MTGVVLAKTAEWHENRLTGVGGSDATILMAGDIAKINGLWMEKRGEKEPDDLSFVLPVQIGTLTEDLNGIFFTHLTHKELSRDNLECRHSNGFMRCELDFRVVGENAVMQAKHVNAFAKLEEVTAKYFWQCQHEMACSNTVRNYLSVFIGTLKHEYVAIDADAKAQAKLEAVEQAFWQSVQDGTPPEAEAHAVEINFDDLREVDVMQTNFASEFSDCAGDWLTNKSAKQAFDRADKGLKGFIADDVKRLFGFGVEVTRAQNGSRRIKEMKDE